MAAARRGAARQADTGLARYRAQRDFARTPEPRGKVGARKPRALAFTIQKHAATRLHYDLRLEMEGVLRSWAVPKGPSLVPGEKRLAVEVEDHPLEYGTFEGTIPKGEYGGGTVMLWDRGTWEPDGDPLGGWRRGKLEFTLRGQKLAGRWTLVRMGGRAARESRPKWLLIKSRDEHAIAPGEADVTETRPESAATGRDLDAIAAGKGRGRKQAWSSKKSSEGGSRGAAKPAPTRAMPRGGARAATTSKASRKTSRSSSPRAGRAPAAATRARRTVPPDAAAIEGSRRAPLPREVEAQLATLVATAPPGDRWLHEIKFDGYRVLVTLSGGKVRWRTRRGQDWSARFRPLDGAVRALPARNAVLDGEVVVLRDDGTTSFQDLQNAFVARPADLTLFAFDLLYLDGRDLRGAVLEDRKRALGALCAALPAGSALRYSDHVVGDGPAFHARACELGLEGIVSKRRDRPYVGGRTLDWQKVKCQTRQELVVGGWTDPQRTRVGLGALLVGYYDRGEGFVYAGKVGTGYDHDTLLGLRKRLGKLRRKDTPFDVGGPRASKGVHFAEPKLVVEVGFTAWTDDGLLRHPAFLGVREDKDPRKVVRERPIAAGGARGAGARPASKGGASAPNARVSATARPPTSATDAEVAGVRLSSPDRVLWPEIGVTKLDLARWYERAAERILPHVAGRPVSVVRCPEGRGQACFFQRHATAGLPSSVRTVALAGDREKRPYLVVDDLAGLVGLVQVGALELHPWGARADRIDLPDKIVLDLDPGPDVAWETVIELARALRSGLEALDLACFAMLTGGKGLHVVVPLARRAGWDVVKGFAARVARGLEKADPDRVVAQASKARRKGRVFVDWLRNARGASAIAPYSTRAREGAPVAMPIAWRELVPALAPDAFTLANAPQRLKRPDPWKDFEASRVVLSAARSRSARDR